MAEIGKPRSSDRGAVTDPGARLSAPIVVVCIFLAGLILFVVAVGFGQPDPAVPAPRPMPVRNDALWLMVGGVVGAFVRAFRTSGQKSIGLETLQDCFLGAVIGLLWTVEVGPLGTVWPPFELSAKASTVQRAGLVAAFVWLTIEVIKPLLFKWVPTYMARFTGGLPPEPPKPPAP